MVQTKIDMFDVIDKIDKYISNFEWPYSDWVVGVSTDPRERLQQVQVLEETMGPWIYKMAANADFAKAIQRHFAEVLGTDSENKETGEGPNIVYAYRRGMETSPVILN